MKNLKFYKTALNCDTEDQVFEYFIANLQKSIADWAYFVAWEKIKKNVARIETELNILNSLLGKSNLDEKFIELVIKYPEARNALPILIAVRRKKLKEMPILKEQGSLAVENKEYLFNYSKFKLNEAIKKELLRFLNESGLKDIFRDRTIKNLVDYCFGVEVGMDTNARKNRGGDNMEDIVESFVSDLCKKNNFRYLKEANAEKIKNELGYDVPVDKSSRRYDFVIDSGKELFINLCQKTHKLACGMNDILLKQQGFLGDGGSPNNRLLLNPMGV
ncbi:MAG: DpnII family type II restriction endonuclease [Campylobacterota bacterium]|nr:DpnII family type II restriction endonuclease [Campylobacterota bacterium]